MSLLKSLKTAMASFSIVEVIKQITQIALKSIKSSLPETGPSGYLIVGTEGFIAAQIAETKQHIDSGTSTYKSLAKAFIPALVGGGTAMLVKVGIDYSNYANSETAKNDPTHTLEDGMEVATAIFAAKVTTKFFCKPDTNTDYEESLRLLP